MQNTRITVRNIPCIMFTPTFGLKILGYRVRIIYIKINTVFIFLQRISKMTTVDLGKIN